MNPAAWPAILAAAADWVGSEKSLLLTPWDLPEQGGFIYAHGITQQQIDLWQTRYQPDDLRARRFTQRGLVKQGAVIFGHEVVPHEELLASDWWRNFLSRLDLFHNASAVVFDREGDVPATLWNCYRGQHAKEFDESQRRRIRLLLPHLSRALGVMFRLRNAEMRVAASHAALNELRTGVLLLDPKGRVCFANRAAGRLLELQDGLRLVNVGGDLSTLAIDDGVAAAAVERCLRGVLEGHRGAARHFSHALRIARPSGRPAYALQLSYLPDRNPYQLGSHEPRAIAFVREDAGVAEVDEALLIKVYGLTPAEARAALVLGHGGSLADAARVLGVRVNTLKTHLKNIYVKMTVRSRAGLTRLLLSLDARG